MLSLKQYLNYNLILISSIFLVIGCGSFSSNGLVTSDGLYEKTQDTKSSSNYYRDYFKGKAIELENIKSYDST